ncbi:MAG: hypothetical protein Q4F40_03580 [Akkermansia sp.]|nr:hypothetical protein [Akkermansia sp.]
MNGQRTGELNCAVLHGEATVFMEQLGSYAVQFSGTATGIGYTQ